MRRLLGSGVALAVALLSPHSVRACSVCWGGASGSDWIEASSYLFVFLTVLTYGVIGGGIFGFVAARRRALRRQREEKP